MEDFKIPFVKTGESEIDYIVVEELFSSNDFQKWLLEKVNIKDNFQFIGAWKSFIGRYGECDIVVEFIIKGKKIMLLIEDKIYSPEQPEQAKRYHKTGRYLVGKSNKDRYITCLLSPKIYFREDAPMKNYEYRISYEELLEWFKKSRNNDERTKFKQIVIQNGIDRARTGYQRITDDNTNKFYNYYEELAREFYPQLEYTKPQQVASGNSWLRFNPKIFPPNVTTIHKGRHGYADLQISGEDINNFLNKYKSKLSKNMTIHKTGKSISVRLITPKISDIEETDEPEKYREEILKGLNAVNLLMEWYLENLENKSKSLLLEKEAKKRALPSPALK